MSTHQHTPQSCPQVSPGFDPGAQEPVTLTATVDANFGTAHLRVRFVAAAAVAECALALHSWKLRYNCPVWHLRVCSAATSYYATSYYTCLLLARAAYLHCATRAATARRCR